MFDHMISLLLLVWLPQTSRYCIENVTVSGLALDRVSDRNTVSVAASGFMMVNHALLLPRDEAIRRVNLCLTSTLKHNPQKNRGWLYHFTDAFGVPKAGVEVSTVDSSIFYAGLKKAAEMLGDPALTARVNEAIGAVDTDWLKAGEYMCHGLHWNGNRPEFIPWVWDEFSEGVIIYDTFGIKYKPTRVRFDLPLFAYYYPLVFHESPEAIGYLEKAVQFQRVNYKHWGVTACDGPSGYTVNDREIISPLALLTVSRYVPEALPYLKTLGVSPETPALEPATKWMAKDRIGIDDMACVAIFGKR